MRKVIIWTDVCPDCDGSGCNEYYDGEELDIAGCAKCNGTGRLHGYITATQFLGAIFCAICAAIGIPLALLWVMLW